MALSFVGSDGNSGIGGNFDLTLPGGIAEGDVVYVITATTGPTAAMGTSGYTTLAQRSTVAASSIRVGIFRKVMGASPDSVANIASNGGGARQSAVCHVWRGADPDDPEAIPPIIVATGAYNNGTPDPLPITAGGIGTAIVVLGASSEGDAVTNPPSGYSNAIGAHDGLFTATMAASKILTTAGEEDPPGFTDIVGQSSDSWVAATIALKAIGTEVTTGAAQRMVPGGPMLDANINYYRQTQIPGAQYVNDLAETAGLAQQGQSPGGPYVQYTR